MHYKKASLLTAFTSLPSNFAVLPSYSHTTASMSVYHNGRYTPIPFDEIIGLGDLPKTAENIIEYCLPEQVPADAKEVLLYLFVTTQTIAGDAKRGFYEVFTKDSDSTQYSQYMNVVFAKDDVTINSANMWLPIFKEKKVYIRIPALYDLKTSATPLVPCMKPAKITFCTLKEAVAACGKTMVSGVFVTGYREPQ